jgi:hypothetical protein
MYEHWARFRLFVANGLNVTRGKNLFTRSPQPGSGETTVAASRLCASPSVTGSLAFILVLLVSTAAIVPIVGKGGV